jgi:hypothetical protein
MSVEMGLGRKIGIESRKTAHGEQKILITIGMDDNSCRGAVKFGKGNPKEKKCGFWKRDSQLGAA